MFFPEINKDPRLAAENAELDSDAGDSIREVIVSFRRMVDEILTAPACPPLQGAQFCKQLLVVEELDAA